MVYNYAFERRFESRAPHAVTTPKDGICRQIQTAGDVGGDGQRLLRTLWKYPFLLDITDDRAPWPIATLDAGQYPGDFCASARFGTHELDRQIYASYGRLIIAAMFNAGLAVWDIRDPYDPRRVAYFIQAPNKNTKQLCGTYRGNTHYCRKAIFSDLGEVDDRGYIDNLARAGSGTTMLKLTGDALAAVGGQGPK